MYTFQKDDRLRKRAEFLLLSKKGHKFYAPDFLLIRQDNDRNSTRIGITVSRKVGNAVVRNRVKRYVREFFRNNKVLFAIADYNVIARSGAAKIDYAKVCKELSDVLTR